MSDTDEFDDNVFSQADETRMASSFGSGSTTGVIKVKKTEYAIGLIWETVSDAATAAQTARDRAGNADFFCVRSGTVTQFGLGERKLGHRVNMPSLAAHVAANRAGQFLALFEVANGYYILAVRHDGINSQLERHIADRHEAVELFEEYSGLDWDEKIAPESFGWPDTTILRLEDCLSGRAPVRLKEVKRKSNVVKLGGLAILVIAGIIGYQVYNKTVADAENARILKEQFDKATKNVPGMKKEEVVVPPPPWERKVAGAPMLNLCVEQILEFPLDIPAWNVTGFTCSNPVDPIAVALISRDKELGDGGGPITWIKNFATPKSYTPELVPDGNGSNNQVSMQWMLYAPGKAPKYAADQVVLPVAKVRQNLLSLFEQRMVPIRFGSFSKNDFYAEMSFEFETHFDPRNFLDIIARVPGVVIENVAYTLADNNWKIKGKTYEQLPLPANAKRQ